MQECRRWAWLGIGGLFVLAVPVGVVGGATGPGG